MDFNSLMQQAQKLQEEMERKEKEVSSKEYRSTVSKNIVELVMNGNYEITEININEDFAKNFGAEDKEILEDSIMLAINEVTKQISADKEGILGDLAGNISLPGLGF